MYLKQLIKIYLRKFVDIIYQYALKKKKSSLNEFGTQGKHSLAGSHVTLAYWCPKGDGQGLGGEKEENNLPRVSYFLIDFPTICIIKNRKTIEGSHCV